MERAGRLGRAAAFELLQSVEHDVGRVFDAALPLKLSQLAYRRVHGGLNVLRERHKGKYTDRVSR